MNRIILIATLLMVTNIWATEKDNTQVINIEVTEKGFQPSSIDVKNNTPIILNVTRKTDATCSKEIQIPSQNVKKNLPLNKMVSINLGKLKKGEIRFGCGLNMMESGIIHAK